MGVFSNYGINESSEILNEAYYGFYTGVDKLTDQLSKVRAKYMSLSKYSLSGSKLNSDKDLYEFCDNVADFFGFRTFNLNIDPSVSLNAYTIPLSYRSTIRTKNIVIRDKNGIRYKDGCDIGCFVFISSALFLNKDFTDKEIMAIILHEIGHNFSYAVDEILSIMEIVNKIQSIPYTLIYLYKTLCDLVNPIVLVADRDVLDQDVRTLSLLTTQGSKLYDKVSKIVKSSAGFQQIDTLSRIPTNVSKYAVDAIGIGLLPVAAVGTLLYIVSGGILQLIFNIVANTYIGKKNERLSDSFATMYGLGSDLGSALNKMSKYGSVTLTEVGKAIKNTPIVGAIYDIIAIPSLFVVGMLDEHPDEVERVYEQVVYLENELDNMQLNPTVKKQLKEDLKFTREQADKMYSEVKPIKGTIVQDVYNRHLYKNAKFGLTNDKSNLNTKSLNTAYDKVKMI